MDEVGLASFIIGAALIAVALVWLVLTAWGALVFPF